MSADAEPGHQRRNDRDRVEDRQPDHPVERERVEARTQAGGAQLEQDAFWRFGGNDRVENVARAQKPSTP